MYEFTKPEMAGLMLWNDVVMVQRKFVMLWLPRCISLSAMCIENMDGDYYIPGTKPDSAEGVWKEAQAGCWWKWNTVSIIFPPTDLGWFGVFVPLWCNRKLLMMLSWLGHPVCSLTTTERLQRMRVPNRRPKVWNQVWIPSWYLSHLKQFSKVMLPSYKEIIFTWMGVSMGVPNHHFLTLGFF